MSRSQKNKLIKRGWKNILGDPSVLVNKENIILNYILICTMAMGF